MTYIDIERTLSSISFLMLFFATPSNWINLSHRSHKISNFSKRSMTIAFACTTGFMITRWIQTKHLPLSNLYESSMFLSWSFSFLHVTSEVNNQNEWSGATPAPSAMPTHAFATSGLPAGTQQSTLLVPALQSHWLTMHVSMMSLSYATLLCGSPSAMSLLIISRDKKDRWSVSDANRISRLHNLLLNSGNDQGRTDRRNLLHLLSLNSRKCQLINQLDKWVYQIISLGFSFLTIGIPSGAVWANEAWGSYRSWDPKETWALATRLIHAIYLHTKITKSWMGEGPAAAASTGFFLVRIRFLGVNLLGIGLHNYGWLI
uniref:Cytochrome c biogenesis protein CcsA n=1 Tax=Saccoloma inaequale TaxID=262953 RepID=A0A5B9RBS5_9MONI|nr:cytochrome c heme attachment protein [Saccoloma inaequale]QEG57841.1 cytochrome c heme attachment protein [Saccoloma inaequale]